MKKLLLVAVLPLVLLLPGCNAQANAQKADQIISAVLQTAKVETPAIPPADQAAYTNFVNLGFAFEAQLKSCINAKGAKFTSCFNGFAQGLLSPAELAQLRVLSPATQAKVQLYVTAVVAAVNVIVAATAPQIAAAPAPVAQLRLLGHRVGLSDADLAHAGI